MMTAPNITNIINAKWAIRTASARILNIRYLLFNFRVKNFVFLDHEKNISLLDGQSLISSRTQAPITR